MTIGELATEITNHDRLSTAGASEAMIGALKRHDNDIAVVSNACYAIHFLCSTENINSWMGANGACEAVTNALIKHRNSSVVVTIAASRALGTLLYVTLHTRDERDTFTSEMNVAEVSSPLSI